jgi:hypothetical protein
MSISKIIIVKCDQCHEETSGDISVAEARETARDDGWRRRRIDGRWLDICYACLHPDEQDE